MVIWATGPPTFTKPRNRKERNPSRHEGIWCPSLIVTSWFGFASIDENLKLFFARYFSRRPGFAWPFSSLFIQQSKQTIEYDSRVLQAFSIIREPLAQSIYDCVKTGSFQPLELVVLEIDVMNYFAELAQTPDLAQTESLDHCLKGAVFTMMCELSTEHVERNRVRHRLALRHEIKARVLVDELLDQPGRSETIDVDVPTSHPTATLIVSARQSVALTGRL